MARVLDVTITYLEQRARPTAPPPPQPAMKLAILRAENPPLHFYRYLYRLVGDPYHWVSRRALSDAELAEIVENPDVHLYVLYAGGVPAGMAEIDAREQDAAEMKFFGLAPEFVGRRLGRYFLHHAIHLAWALNRPRVRLETCTLDHPAALPLYQKMGFSVYEQRKGQVSLPDD